MILRYMREHMQFGTDKTSNLWRQAILLVRTVITLVHICLSFNDLFILYSTIMHTVLYYTALYYTTLYCITTVQACAEDLARLSLEEEPLDMSGTDLTVYSYISCLTHTLILSLYVNMFC